MDIRLSWDLFTIVLFLVIIAYSFIIGRDNTLKVILGTYVAALAADATGTLFEVYFSGSKIFQKVLRLVTIENDDEAIIFIKVIVFVGLVIAFAVRGAFQVKTVDDSSPAIRLILLVVYASMSAGLILSTILVFVSGVSFIGGSPETTKNALMDIYNRSGLVRTLINNSHLWFSLPALAFLIHSLYTNRNED